jgi:hypothetical protein
MKQRKIIMNKKEWVKSVAKEVGETEELVDAILETGLEKIYQSMK